MRYIYFILALVAVVGVSALAVWAIDSLVKWSDNRK